jgi:hypothetical protein
MGSEFADQCKTSIKAEIKNIIDFVDKFESLSGKDEQSLAEILVMANNMSKRVHEIDLAHKKRIELTKELMKTLNELEDSHKNYANKFANK